jgi:endonuclease YncB( thermonuclease family)
MRRIRRKLTPVWLLTLTILACEVSVGVQNNNPPAANAPANDGVAFVVGDTAVVTEVIDGDTIDVNINGVEQRVRYIGINTPERDQVCSREASDANTALVQGQTVTLVRDVSETDRFGRLLRYVYVNGVNVNEQLVAQGYAEAVEYPPDIAQTAAFRALEIQARAANLGCHPTGVFNDGSDVR